MVEEILQWLKNISIFLIFMTTVLNLIPEKEDKAPEAEAVNSKSFRIRKANIKIRQFTHMESEKGSIWVLLYKKEKFTCNGCIYVLSSFW